MELQRYQNEGERKVRPHFSYSNQRIISKNYIAKAEENKRDMQYDEES